MPNWKTLEAREKLLAATVASLDIKALNYRKIATYYGEGTTYDSIEGQFRSVRKVAQQLRDAVESGTHPEAPERGSGPTSRRAAAVPKKERARPRLSQQASQIAPQQAQQVGQSQPQQPQRRDGVLTGRITKSKSITPSARNGAGLVKGLKQEVESSAGSMAPSPADSFDLPQQINLSDDFAIQFGGMLDGAMDDEYNPGFFEFEA